MPIRMIREGLLDSEKSNNLSEGAFGFFVRLLLVADDFGLFDSRPNIILNRCYPCGNCTLIKAKKYLEEIKASQLIEIYNVGEKEYIFIPKFFQRLRAMKSKYPLPPKELTDKYPSNDRRVTDACTQPSNSNSNSNSSSFPISNSDSNSGKGKRDLKEIQQDFIDKGKS